MTFTPRPVMILKPRLSAVSLRSTRIPQPETISASFGSATLYRIRSSPKITITATTAMPTISRMFIGLPHPSLLCCW